MSVRGCVNHRFNTPKKAYSTAQPAVEHAARMNLVNADRGAVEMLEAYPCPQGIHGWHVGRTPHWSKSHQLRSTLMPEIGERAWWHLCVENSQRYVDRVTVIRDKTRTALVKAAA